MDADGGLNLIIGAHTPLGGACVRELARRGLPVIGVVPAAETLPARAVERASVAGAEWLSADCGTLEGQGRVIEAMRQRGPLRRLLLSLGKVPAGPFQALDSGIALARLHADIVATVLFLRAALPFMCERDRGSIVVLGPEWVPAGQAQALQRAIRAFVDTLCMELQAELMGGASPLETLWPQSGQEQASLLAAALGEFPLPKEP